MEETFTLWVFVAERLGTREVNGPYASKEIAVFKMGQHQAMMKRMLEDPPPEYRLVSLEGKVCPNGVEQR